MEAEENNWSTAQRLGEHSEGYTPIFHPSSSTPLHCWRLSSAAAAAPYCSQTDGGNCKVTMLHSRTRCFDFEIVATYQYYYHYYMMKMRLK